MAKGVGSQKMVKKPKKDTTPPKAISLDKPQPSVVTQVPLRGKAEAGEEYCKICSDAASAASPPTQARILDGVSWRPWSPPASALRLGRAGAAHSHSLFCAGPQRGI